MKALQFSGGKDSLACLFLLEPEWPDLVVIWVNTGDAYPDTLERMAYWRRTLPHFLEVRSSQPEQIQRCGYPSDVVPVRYTRVARIFGASEGPLIQSYLECCNENIWQPMCDVVEKLGIATLVRGTRKSDSHKAPIEPGQTIDGITYEMPIWDWSDEQVFEFLGDRAPSYYQTESDGRDCQLCTAYRKDNQVRPRNLPEPLRSEFDRRVTLIARLVDEESRGIPI